jgi:K+-sensing histidine kinase KdpD
MQPSSRSSWRGTAAALAAFVFATALGLAISARWSSSSVVLLYVPPVLTAAAFAGRRAALLVAVLATLTYNFFFTQPYYTLLIRDPGDVVTVAMLLLVALVTSHLVASMRAQSQLAAFHAARNATIAGFARQLLSCTDQAAIAKVAVAELSCIFDCLACVIVAGPEPAVIAATPGLSHFTQSDLAAAALAMTTGARTGREIGRNSLTDWQFHPITSFDQILAAAGLARDDGTSPVTPEGRSLLGNLLDQVALALERARLERAGLENIILRERDDLRSVLLGSIGNDIRPRLHAIGAAVRRLQRAGEADGVLLSEISSETNRLNGFIDNLVNLDLTQNQDPIVVGDVAIDLYRRTVTKAGEPVRLTPKEYAVVAELARSAGRVLSHGYLLRAVWGPAHEDHIDYLRVAVSALRRKLETDPGAPDIIVNVPAIGYRLAKPDQLARPGVQTAGLPPSAE